jgi:hypothetical protein
MKTQNGRCAFLQAGMDQNGLGDRNRLGERAAKEPSKEKTKLANLTRAGKGLDQISKPLPVTHRTDQEKEKKKIGQHFSLADERAEHRRKNKSAGRSEPRRAAGSQAKRTG